MIEVVVILIMTISFFKEYKNGLYDNLLAIGLSGGLVVLVFAFIHFIKLETIIDENGISYQFIPIHLKPRKVLWTQLKKCYVRKYAPIKEFGGWGIRGLARRGVFDLKGRGQALNIAGDMGIQLEFIDGGQLLIGTQKAENAKRIIEFYSDKLNDNSQKNY